MRERIIESLKRIAGEENVAILYACESGSRAWGFPSADSDYDVRFVYAHPLDWYLSIGERRDVIERPLDGNLDINGWDIRKALGLFCKSNPPLYEWLNSPIVYWEKTDFAERLRELAKVYYSPTACIYHYLHMAQGNYKDYLKGETVWVKKYFYVLRPLLAIQWIEHGYGVAPTAFGTLVERMVTDTGLKDEIYRLIEAKRAGNELDKGARIPVVSEFIEREIERLESGKNLFPNHPAPIPLLDELFAQTVKGLAGDEAWDSGQPSRQ